MKVLLINLPLRLNAPPEAFPTGLGIIAKVLYTEGHDVRILDVNALRYTKEQVSEWLSFYNDVDVVGISGLITTYGYQKLLISEIKKRIPKADVISGGGCASSAPHILMANTPVDIFW